MKEAIPLSSAELRNNIIIMANYFIYINSFKPHKNPCKVSTIINFI